MKHEYLISACSGRAIDVKAGQLISVIDIDGGQVVDFFAENASNGDEFVSPGVTSDCNESLRIHVGDTLYSNLYHPMFTIIADDVGEHDLLHPCCRPEMYEFFYQNGEGHANCLDNINGSLGRKHPIIHPINLFMYTAIEPNGKIIVKPPLSRAGDRIVLRAEMDVRLGIAACSVSESDCNSGKCSAIQIVVEDA